MQEILKGASLLLLGQIAAGAAMAQTPPTTGPSQSLTASAESRDYTEDRGSFRSLALEFKRDGGDTTFLITPSFGERRGGGTNDTAVALRGTLYHDWSASVSTRTSVFVAEDTPVFAHIDVAQDLTFRIGDKTTATLGGRWAEYFADREVSFVSLGVRRYFDRGSLSYRLTRTEAEGGDSFFAHLASVSFNDRRGAGKTQAWLTAGEAGLSNAAFDESFSGSNRAFMLQRIQPLTGEISLVVSAGLSAYDTPAGDYNATTVGIGVTAGLK